MVELYAGLATNALCYDHHGFDVAAVAESSAAKQRHVRATFADVAIIQDARTTARDLRSSAGSSAVAAPARVGNVVIVAGGVPCTPVAPNGQQLGLADPRAPDTTDALPRAADELGADAADAD